MRRLSLAVALAGLLLLPGCSLGAVGLMLGVSAGAADTISTSPSAVGVIKNLINRKCTFETFETCGKSSAAALTPVT